MLRILGIVSPILLLDWLLIVFIEPDSATGWWQPVAVGLVFGSMFGQTTLAAVAAALFPAQPTLRLPVSLFWVFMLGVGLAINLRLNGGPRDMGIVFGALLFSQWLVLLLILWSIRFAFGFNLSRFQDEPSTHDPGQHQFGIRQLMMVTALVGVMLAIGRLLMPMLIDVFPSHDLPTLIFLVVAEVVLTLPLVLATLLRRFAILGTLLALAFVAAVTFGEVPLLRLLAVGPGPQTADFVGVNAVASALVTTVLAVVRLNGYSLGSSRGRVSAAT